VLYYVLLLLGLYLGEELVNRVVLCLFIVTLPFKDIYNTDNDDAGIKLVKVLNKSRQRNMQTTIDALSDHIVCQSNEQVD